MALSFWDQDLLPKSYMAGFDTYFIYFDGQHPDYCRGKTGSLQTEMMVLFLDLMKNKAKFG